MGNRNRAKKTDPNQVADDNKSNSLSPIIIAAIITALATIVTAMFIFVGTRQGATLPIEATQTAEALHTLVAMQTQSQLLLNTFTPSPTFTPTLTKTLESSATPSPTHTPTATPFEVFGNFHPSLLMGDMGDVQVNPANLPGCSGTCVEVVFTPLGKGNSTGFHSCDMGILSKEICKWTGIYWVFPPGNDGFQCRVGHDLAGYSRLRLRARSIKGNITVSFLTGGVGLVVATQPPCPDSFYLPPVKKTLNSEEWSDIYLELNDKDRSYVIGGLAVTMAWLDNQISNPSNTPIGIYVDNVRFEP